MSLKRPPLAPSSFPSMPDINGIDMWVANSGAKYENRPDILLVSLGTQAKVAGVFTRSTAPGAPVLWSKTRLENKAAGGILVNAGNANVFTGLVGEKGVAEMARLGAEVVGCTANDIYVCSTGVIGEPLAMGPIAEALRDDGFLKNTGDWRQAAQAISTTDTYAKGSAQKAMIGDTEISICGIAKGSGMIAPDMATMLAFIFTDANIEQNVLQEMLIGFCATSFNAITVDSDTSTSDTVLLAASATANHSLITTIDDPQLSGFKQALYTVMLDLAHQVVKDGEGAQKFVEITVTGARSKLSAKTIAMSIANSPLVKTAIAGEDANWGRIVMAVGKSGEPANRDRLSIMFGEHLVAKNGMRAPDYNEEQMKNYMENSHLNITVDVGVGGGKFTVWGCDLTHGYININADYRS